MNYVLGENEKNKQLKIENELCFGIIAKMN